MRLKQSDYSVMRKDKSLSNFFLFFLSFILVGHEGQKDNLIPWRKKN